MLPVLVVNLGLVALLRAAVLVPDDGGLSGPGALMAALGVAALGAGAVALHRSRSLTDLAVCAAAAHAGVATMALGLGATVAGLLHLTLHSLAISAILAAARRPVLGWGILAVAAALAGLPPFGLFISETMVVTAAAGRSPALAVTVSIGLLVLLATTMARVQRICLSEPAEAPSPSFASAAPVLVQLAPVLVAGLWLPPSLAAWLQASAHPFR